MELLTKSRVCQGPGVTEKAKVPVRGGDAPAPVYRWPECGFSFCGEMD